MGARVALQRLDVRALRRARDRTDSADAIAA